MASLIRFGPSGGGGGQKFDDMREFYPNGPSPDLRIAQVRVRSKDRIDAIEVTWSDGRSIHRGGSGGQWGATVLPPIIEVSGSFGSRVDRLVLNRDTKEDPSERWFGGSGGCSEFNYPVPPGFVLIGFFGRAWAEIDSLGVILMSVP